VSIVRSWPITAYREGTEVGQKQTNVICRKAGIAYRSSTMIDTITSKKSSVDCTAGRFGCKKNVFEAE